MPRKSIAMAATWALIVAFIALLNAFEPNRLAQTVAAIGYAVAIFVTTRWAMRPHA